MYFILASVPAWSVITEREREREREREGERERDFGHMSLPVTSVSSSFHRECEQTYTTLLALGASRMHGLEAEATPCTQRNRWGAFRHTVVAHGRESPLAGIILAGYFIGA